MEYKKINNYSYNLHVIKTKKFKTVTVQLGFRRKLKKEDITYRNMIVNMLCESTSDYPTRRLMHIATEDLYEIKYNGSNYISGKYNVMGFNVTFLNEEYTEKGMLDKSIKFLADLVFKPNVERRRNVISFKEENFNLAYNVLKNNILSLKEDTDTYSRIRMLENLEPDSAISYRAVGYLEDLEKIDCKKLYKYYETILNSDIIDIFVIGDVSERHIKKIVEDTFSGIKTFKKPSESHFIEHKKIRLVPKVVKEHQQLNQSKLVLGYKIKNMTEFERKYVLSVLTYILGGGSDSKLFKTVREKNSLCYSIFSASNSINSLFFIKAGINKDDYKKALTLIKKEFMNMRKGNFSSDDIIKAKITYINSLREIEDNPLGILSLYAGKEYLGSDDLEIRFKRINKVTKSDVIKLAFKMHLDTIYLLEGESNEEK